MIEPPRIEPRLADRAAVRTALLSLLTQTRLGLKALVPRLEPALWDDPAVVEALRTLLLGHSRAQVAICVQDTAGIRGDLTRLPALVDRLPSRCSLRLAGRQDRELPESYVLLDDRYYLYRATPQARAWHTHAEPPSEARLLAARFADLWERAENHPDLRRLSL